MSRPKYTSAFLIVILTLFSACSNNKPQPINTELDICTYCKMAITNPRFASEIKTARGKVHKFDSIECMLSFYENHKNSYKKPPHIWVHDFLHPKQWIPKNKAVYIRDNKIHSPMAMDLLAVKNDSEAVYFKRKYGGNELSWKDMIKYVNKNMNKINKK